MANQVNEREQELQAIVADIVPKSLDDIIRQHREKAQLRLSNTTEIEALAKVISPAAPKDILEDWILITLYQYELGSGLVFLLGKSRRSGVSHVTSVIVGIDLEKQLVITKSGSVYQISKPKDGGPSTHELYLICAAFHAWGFGEMLGVPHFYY